MPPRQPKRKELKSSSSSSESTGLATQPLSNAFSPPFKKPKRRKASSKGKPNATTPRFTGRPPAANAGRTPAANRVGSTSAHTSRFTSSSQISTERHQEAECHLLDRLVKDQDSILELARPLDPERRSLVQDIASETAQFLESYLATEPAANQGESVAAMGTTAELHPDSPMQPPNSMPTPQAGATLENSALLREKLGLAKRWLLWQSIDNKKRMYKSIRALVEFLALVVQGRLAPSAEMNSSSGLGRRLVLPSSKPDFEPIDADDGMHIDMGLTCAKPGSKAGALREQVSYYELLAVLEAEIKGGNSGFEQAFKQLIVYTQQMFQQQHNLRFAWGITASGRDARVCHFGPDKAVSSRPTSVATADGRRAFIEVLVNWS
ncbi:hypothetical protein IWW37_005898, partial [Coemansia sp. RSA 2050]